VEGENSILFLRRESRLVFEAGETRATRLNEGVWCPLNPNRTVVPGKLVFLSTYMSKLRITQRIDVTWNRLHEILDKTRALLTQMGVARSASHTIILYDVRLYPCRQEKVQSCLRRRSQGHTRRPFTLPANRSSGRCEACGYRHISCGASLEMN
jgi:hypothetical protein